MASFLSWDAIGFRTVQPTHPEKVVATGHPASAGDDFSTPARL
jgi:hypothetical protein